MDDSVKIFLDKYRSKSSTNTSSGVNVKLMGSRKLLPTNDVSDVISQNEQYNEERENCNIIRLTCQVNPVCSNVLFNRITEIVKDEGSSDVTFINYQQGTSSINGVIGKNNSMDFWGGNALTYENTFPMSSNSKISNFLSVSIPQNTDSLSSSSNHPTNSIRDLQLSKLGFVYHCGLDIFNCHLLRSNTFKSVCKINGGGYDAFNTIADIMRESNGNRVIEKMPFPENANVANNAKMISMHLYEYDNIENFNDCVEKKLIGKYNGWVGFTNASKIKNYIDFKEDEPLAFEKPLSYKSGGDFIDMYPSRDLYSFVPKYNPYRNRIEKNWNYCITYPSSSYTPTSDSEPFGEVIDSKLHSLRVAQFDENTRADNGSLQIVFYCVSKHGLSVGDYVNIYKTWNENGDRNDEKIIDSIEVKNVVDDFIFTVFNPNIQISKKWVDKDEDGYDAYPIINNKYRNVDDDAQRLSFKKVVNDIECDYYVRIFSKLPNFKWASGDTSTEYEIYRKRDNGKSMLETYQSHDYDFENHVSRLAFAQNSYSDNIGEIVFTDDIDISNIKDNLGRPLTSLYLTIIKNNNGYKEWYGYKRNGWQTSFINDENVEYSHCFGKIKCGIEMSYVCNDITKYKGNIRKVEFNEITGYQIRPYINENPKTSEYYNDEVDFNIDINYYGDISYFDNYNSIERHIQPIFYRFNTAQRESVNSSSKNYFNSFVYDEIARDDYDTEPYKIEATVVENANNKKEGYFYNPHYEIPIKTFDKLRTIMPDFLTLRDIKINGGNNSLEITTLQNHYLTKGDKLIIYDWENMVYYYCTTISNINDRVFRCNVYDEYGNIVNVNSADLSDLSKLKAFKMDNLDAPSYARVLKDGTCRVIWRDILNNGFNKSDTTVEEYPFTNGAFYINKRIDMYVRRQDPFNEYGLYDEYDLLGNTTEYTDEDNYVKEQEIEC